MCQPIVLTLMSRKMPEKILLSDIHEQLGDIDEALGGFEEKRSILDFPLTLMK